MCLLVQRCEVCVCAKSCLPILQQTKGLAGSLYGVNRSWSMCLFVNVGFPLPCFVCGCTKSQVSGGNLAG